MDLLEYQAKTLFREMGIPVLPSQRITRPQDLKQLGIPYPIVLKSQVYIGGRGRVGGVKFAETTIDAIAAAQAIFNLPIMGEYPKVLLAEAKYNADRELYLAVALNRALRRPVLLGSVQGGVDVREAIGQMPYVLVDRDFSAYYARRLVLKMGLSGELMNRVSAIVEKMYHLFVQKDLDLVEINPLGVSPNGDLMALDGKVIVNDDALARHRDLQAWLAESMGQQPSSYLSQSLVPLEANGTIGILCNGAGLTLATLDLVTQSGGEASYFVNIGGETHWDSSVETLQARIDRALIALESTGNTGVILVNIVSGLISSRAIADALLDHVGRWSVESDRRPEIILRWIGEAHPIQERLATQGITVCEDLEDAAKMAVTLAHQMKKMGE